MEYYFEGMKLYSETVKNKVRKEILFRGKEILNSEDEKVIRRKGILF